MAKRKTFYAQADLFEAHISPRAKLILAYLSRVSDRQGVSFPSVPTIAEKCGCCPNSARKALRELEAAGFLSISANTLPTRRGRQRRTSNTYTLLFFPSQNEGLPLHPVQGGPSTDEGLSHNSKFILDVPNGHSQSVDENDPDGGPGEKGLRAIQQIACAIDIEETPLREILENEAETYKQECVMYNEEHHEESPCTIICSGGGGREFICDTTCPN